MGRHCRWEGGRVSCLRRLYLFFFSLNSPSLFQQEPCVILCFKKQQIGRRHIEMNDIANENLIFCVASIYCTATNWIG